MMNPATLVSTILVLSLGGSAHGFVAQPVAAPSFHGLKSTTDAEIAEPETASPSAGSADSPKALSPLFEYLKFDKEPSFDVLAKTKSYIEDYQRRFKDPSEYEHLYDENYVLRGPVIGPINRKDLTTSQTGLGLRDAFPNLTVDTFGYTIDPENPYRCFYFQRWRAVMEHDMDAYGDIYPATNEMAEMPVSVFSVVWTPEGKIIYEQVGAVVDRMEGNTQGKAAVFGLLHHAGLKLNAQPGDKAFAFIQRLGHILGGRGRSWSRKPEVPKWWVSKSKGADETDQW